jgi:hypothetical protein
MHFPYFMPAAPIFSTLQSIPYNLAKLLVPPARATSNVCEFIALRLKKETCHHRETDPDAIPFFTDDVTSDAKWFMAWPVRVHQMDIKCKKYG